MCSKRSYRARLAPVDHAKDSVRSSTNVSTRDQRLSTSPPDLTKLEVSMVLITTQKGGVHSH